MAMRTLITLKRILCEKQKTAYEAIGWMSDALYLYQSDSFINISDLFVLAGVPRVGHNCNKYTVGNND